MSNNTIPSAVAAMIAAAHNGDTDLFVAQFADDALINDRHRRFWGTDAIRQWCQIEITGDKVTMTPVDVVNLYGDAVMVVEFDGEYDKGDLPARLLLGVQCVVRDDRITTMTILPINGRNLSRHNPSSLASSAFATSFQVDGVDQSVIDGPQSA